MAALRFDHLLHPGPRNRRHQAPEGHQRLRRHRQLAGLRCERPRIPVILPDLRPMVQRDGGCFIPPDLNDLYRRVINCNTRPAACSAAPPRSSSTEKRMLQESVGRPRQSSWSPCRGSGQTSPEVDPDMLKGKQGCFQNLLSASASTTGPFRYRRRPAAAPARSAQADSPSCSKPPSRSARLRRTAQNASRCCKVRASAP